MKPHNVLVFEDPSGHFTARVADFGFSTHCRGEGDLIQMPRSAIWYPPEWHDGYFSARSAQKMDIFSYSLLCLWMLSADPLKHPLPLHPEYMTAKKEVICFDSSRPREENLIELWKQSSDDHLRTWATWYISAQIMDHTETSEKSLCRFFDCTLAQSPESRSTDWSDLLKLLAPQR